jgi:hypothetical protein
MKEEEERKKGEWTNDVNFIRIYLNLPEFKMKCIAQTAYPVVTSPPKHSTATVKTVDIWSTPF